MTPLASVGAVVAAALSAGAAASPALAAAPRVDAMIVGRTAVLQQPAEVSVAAARVKAGRRTCAVAAGTALGALVALRKVGGPSFAVSDYGACSSAPRDATGLFVTRIGTDANAGSDGWVYKVGNKAGSTGAGDASGAFGTGRRLRDGQRVLWYWCKLSAGQRCPATLDVSLDAAGVGAAAAVRVTVKAYDDDGRGALLAGATVTLQGVSATTGPDGTATISAPATPGTYDVTAAAPGDVTGFPAHVQVT